MHDYSKAPGFQAWVERFQVSEVGNFQDYMLQVSRAALLQSFRVSRRQNSNALRFQRCIVAGFESSKGKRLNTSQGFRSQGYIVQGRMVARFHGSKVRCFQGCMCARRERSRWCCIFARFKGSDHWLHHSKIPKFQGSRAPSCMVAWLYTLQGCRFSMFQGSTVPGFRPLRVPKMNACKVPGF